MELIKNAGDLWEVVRLLKRKLGILDELYSSCSGLTLPQCHAIMEIGIAQNSSLNNLAEILGLDKSTMSRTINNLVNNGLAEREINANDRRYITIKLTENGWQSFREIEERMGSYFTRLYDLIPAAKRDQVIESLQVLLEALTGNDCCRLT